MDYIIEAYLIFYPTINVVQGRGTITYIDPCAAPISLKIVEDGTTNLFGPYMYDETNLSTLIRPFIPNPVTCIVTYTCETYALGPSVLPCNNGVETIFNTDTGVITLKMGTDSFSQYKPGVYEYTIFGSTGTVYPKTT